MYVHILSRLHHSWVHTIQTPPCTWVSEEKERERGYFVFLNCRGIFCELCTSLNQPNRIFRVCLPTNCAACKGSSASVTRRVTPTYFPFSASLSSFQPLWMNSRPIPGFIRNSCQHRVRELNMVSQPSCNFTAVVIGTVRFLWSWRLMYLYLIMMDLL